jgi:putative membrane protein
MLRRPGTDAEHLASVSRLAVRRGFVHAWVPAAMATVAVGWWWSWWWLAAAILWLPVALIWAKARWVALGYRLDADLFVARSGVLTRRTWFVPTAKVQAVGLRTSPFQRRLGLADLLVETAAVSSGTIVVTDLEAGVARDLAELLTERSANALGAVDGV